MGAVPFLTAAEMTDDARIRPLLYLGSGLAGTSRINDDAHYLDSASLARILTRSVSEGTIYVKSLAHASG